MKRSRTRALSFLLTIAMVLSLLVLPAAAEWTPTATYDFVNDTDFRSCGIGTSDGEFTWGSVSGKGYIMEGGGSVYGLLMNNRSTLTIPVSGACDIKITFKQKEYLKLDGEGQGVNDGTLYNPGTYTFHYENTENATSVTLTSDGGQSYIQKIEVGPLTAPAPELSLTPESVSVKMGETATVTASVANATRGEVTATSKNTGIAQASAEGGTITITPVAVGDTEVDVSVAISEAEDGSTDALTATIPVKVEAAGLTTSWDLNDSAASVLGTSGGTWKGLTVSGSPRYAGGSNGVQLGAGSTFTFPVAGDCDIKVTGSWKWDVYLGGTEDFHVTEADGNPGILYYRGEAGNVTLYSGNNNCYITKIEVVANSDPAPAALVLDKSAVTLKMDGTTTAEVNATVRNATGAVTATPADGAVVKAEVSDKKITLTALKDGETTVEVAVEGTDLKQTINVTVEPAGEVVYDSWDFTASTWTTEEKQNIQGKTATLRGLEIDATVGQAKFNGTQLGTAWVQFNKDTIIKVPVQVPDGKKALVSVKAYAANTISVDGVPNQKANEVEQFVCAGTDGWVTILGLGGQGYLASISVEYGEGELTPILNIDKDYLGLEMGKTESGEITVTRINTTAAVKAVSADESVATAAVDGDKVTITAVGAGQTTVDISLDGVTESALNKKTVTVDVASAGQVFYISEGTYDFAGYTADNISSIKGLDTHGAIPQAASPSHGLQESGAGAGTSGTATGKIELTVNIPEGKTADLIFVTCRFGIGTALLMESTSGTVTKAEAEVDSATGLQYTVAGASGETTLTFHIPEGKDPEGNEWNKGIWIHSMSVLFGAQKEEDRKIDVWDLTGQEETGESYRNNITAQGWKDSGAAVNGVLSGGTEFTVGDFTLIHNTNDRLYSGVEGAADYGAGATAGYGKWTFEGDSYEPNGGVYCNGKGSATTRYMQVKNVFPGDKLVVYGGSAQTGAVTFNFEGLGGAASQPIESFTVPDAGTGKKMEFVAQATGTYKIWCSDPGKPMYQRVVRVPGVPVTGAITLPQDYTGPAEYGIKFVNTTTKAVTVAEVKNDQYTVTLAPGYEYNAIMTGARGWGFTVNTKKATTAEDGGVGVDAGMTHDMTVEPKQTYTFSGSFVGFADGYDISKLTVDLIPEEGSGSDDTALEITGKTFTAILDPEVEYTLVLGGVNDYVIKTPLTMKSDKDDVIQDITVEPKATYAVSGKFTGLGEDGTVTALNFENVDDKYTYAATVTADGYSVNLRPGSYAAKATVEGKYATKTHVVVVDKAVEKDLMFVSTAAKPAVDKVKDVYVGYAAKSPNFDTVSAAMDAVSRMGIAAEADRVTVHIAPGTYREQIMVTTPYVTFINDEPAKGEVLLTWYYGIGYKYYSAGSPAEGGYYNAERAYDKFEKNIADRWGTAVRVTGKAFRAENITFENSFNRYITEEEIVDGVELAGTGGSATIRQYGVDVTSKAATERAAAICVEADESEFYNCKFYSSQDTVYTQGKVYFKNCLIEGQTDYIFGDLASKCIFDACQLSWKGYGADSQGGYITALRSNKGEGGYLFRNCAVTANSKLTVTPGYFGRPWGADAAVFFLNTKLEKANLITDVGWYDMSGNKPENAQFAEFGTTVMGGTAVDTSKRAGNTVKTQADADALKMSDYFGTWVPYYYTAEAETVAFTTDPTITDNGDINTPYPGHTLTVHYSLGAANDANDASLIQWSRVSADGTETVVKTTTAAVGKTYQIAKADQGATIKVTVTPTTVSGKTGAAKSITMDNPVREGYEDPTGKTDPELGDGVNIFLAGDSTVFDYNGRDEGSWGEFLQNYFNKDYVTVVDHAVGGRSCRSFINEGRLDTIAANIKEGDFLLIQFGHNDCANEDAYRAERYAPLGDPDANGNYPSTAGTKDADGKYTWNCGGTYKWYLQQYIDVAKKAGATPILVTPVARLYYESDGTIRPHHDASLVPGTEETTKTTNPNKSDTYVAAVKQLAQENKIACIDGFGITKALYEDAYKAAGNNTYGQQVMHSGDSTHSNKLGGMIQAAEIASALQNMGLTISKTVKAPAMAMAQTVKGQTVFSVNGAGKLTAYDMLTKPEPYAETAPYWMGVGQKLFDDIAAKAKELNGGSTTDPSQPPVDPSDPPKPADKAALTEAIAAAEKKAADTYTVSDDTKAGDVSRGTKFVTERDKAALTAAIAAAKSVADKADATAQEIAKAVADLKAAVETFDKAVKTGTKGSGGGSTSRPSGSATNAGTTSTVKNPDGSVATIKKAANGDKTITVKDKNGEVVAEVTLPATISTGKTKFVDVPGEHWAAKSINNMAALGMVKGVTEDTFDMTSPMTRGAIATILFRLSNGKEGKSVTFADVAKDAWYADAVGWAAGAKLITGYDETTFGPEDTITRQQLAVMIARYARLLGLDTTADTGALNAFTDGSSTDTWATDAMAWCVKAGVMNGRGNGTVDPKTNVTRAEAAAMLDRMIGLLK